MFLYSLQFTTSTFKHTFVAVKLYEMKFIIVFVALFAFALANKDAETLRYDSNVEPENYNYAVETSDGKSAQEEGHLENAGTDDEAISVRGSYSYIGDDGQTYQVNYIADRNGFQPQETVVLKSESEVGPESFQYAYATSDGVEAQAQGQLKNVGTEQEALGVKGSYSFVRVNMVKPTPSTMLLMKTVSNPKDATVLRSESEVGPESFQYAFATSDGVEAQAQGQLKNVGTDEEAIVVKGSYSFVADDGQTYTVNYVADENGFQPQDAVVLRSESEVGPESYQYAYETSDGNKAEEQGQLKNVGSEDEAIVVRGSYSFVADDGQTYTVNYVADENGFQPQDAVVLRSESEVGPESYQYAYETSDGNKAEEQGQLKNVGSEDEAIVVRGSYSFVADDGQTYTVNYVADENGFQPQGAHLPVAPEA
ncbi:Larval cuticle protein 8 [Lucilia cuprina]|nr:Larval cuticle protein 8 [Lucilia cuprina]